MKLIYGNYIVLHIFYHIIFWRRFLSTNLNNKQIAIFLFNRYLKALQVKDLTVMLYDTEIMRKMLQVKLYSLTC